MADNLNRYGIVFDAAVHVQDVTLGDVADLGSKLEGQLNATLEKNPAFVDAASLVANKMSATISTGVLASVNQVVEKLRAGFSTLKLNVDVAGIDDINAALAGMNKIGLEADGNVVSTINALNSVVKRLDGKPITIQLAGSKEQIATFRRQLEALAKLTSIDASKVTFRGLSASAREAGARAGRAAAASFRRAFREAVAGMRLTVPVDAQVRNVKMPPTATTVGGRPAIDVPVVREAQSRAGTTAPPSTVRVASKPEPTASTPRVSSIPEPSAWQREQAARDPAYAAYMRAREQADVAFRASAAEQAYQREQERRRRAAADTAAAQAQNDTRARERQTSAAVAAASARTSSRRPIDPVSEADYIYAAQQAANRMAANAEAAAAANAGLGREPTPDFGGPTSGTTRARTASNNAAVNAAEQAARKKMEARLAAIKARQDIEQRRGADGNVLTARQILAQTPLDEAAWREIENIEDLKQWARQGNPEARAKVNELGRNVAVINRPRKMVREARLSAALAASKDPIVTPAQLRKQLVSKAKLDLDPITMLQLGSVEGMFTDKDYADLDALAERLRPYEQRGYANLNKDDKQTYKELQREAKAIVEKRMRPYVGRVMGEEFAQPMVDALSASTLSRILTETDEDGVRLLRPDSYNLAEVDPALLRRKKLPAPNSAEGKRLMTLQLQRMIGAGFTMSSNASRGRLDPKQYYGNRVGGIDPIYVEILEQGGIGLRDSMLPVDAELEAQLQKTFQTTDPAKIQEAVDRARKRMADNPNRRIDSTLRKFVQDPTFMDRVRTNANNTRLRTLLESLGVSRVDQPIVFGESTYDQRGGVQGETVVDPKTGESQFAFNMSRHTPTRFERVAGILGYIGDTGSEEFTHAQRVLETAGLIERGVIDMEDATDPDTGAPERIHDRKLDPDAYAELQRRVRMLPEGDPFREAILDMPVVPNPEKPGTFFKMREVEELNQRFYETTTPEVKKAFRSVSAENPAFWFRGTGGSTTTEEQRFALMRRIGLGQNQPASWLISDADLADAGTSFRLREQTPDADEVWGEIPEQDKADIWGDEAIDLEYESPSHRGTAWMDEEERKAYLRAQRKIERERLVQAGLIKRRAVRADAPLVDVVVALQEQLGDSTTVALTPTGVQVFPTEELRGEAVASMQEFGSLHAYANEKGETITSGQAYLDQIKRTYEREKELRKSGVQAQPGQDPKLGNRLSSQEIADMYEQGFDRRRVGNVEPVYTTNENGIAQVSAYRFNDIRMPVRDPETGQMVFRPLTIDRQAIAHLPHVGLHQLGQSTSNIDTGGALPISPRTQYAIDMINAVAKYNTSVEQGGVPRNNEILAEVDARAQTIADWGKRHNRDVSGTLAAYANFRERLVANDPTGRDNPKNAIKYWEALNYVGFPTQGDGIGASVGQMITGAAGDDFGEYFKRALTGEIVGKGTWGFIIAEILAKEISMQAEQARERLMTDEFGEVPEPGAVVTEEPAAALPAPSEDAKPMRATPTPEQEEQAAKVAEDLADDLKVVAAASGETFDKVADDVLKSEGAVVQDSLFADMPEATKERPAQPPGDGPPGKPQASGFENCCAQIVRAVQQVNSTLINGIRVRGVTGDVAAGDRGPGGGFAETGLGTESQDQKARLKKLGNYDSFPRSDRQLGVEFVENMRLRGRDQTGVGFQKWLNDNQLMDDKDNIARLGAAIDTGFGRDFLERMDPDRMNELLSDPRLFLAAEQGDWQGYAAQARDIRITSEYMDNLTRYRRNREAGLSGLNVSKNVRSSHEANLGFDRVLTMLGPDANNILTSRTPENMSRVQNAMKMASHMDQRIRMIQNGISNSLAFLISQTAFVAFGALMQQAKALEEATKRIKAIANMQPGVSEGQLTAAADRAARALGTMRAQGVEAIQKATIVGEDPTEAAALIAQMAPIARASGESVDELTAFLAAARSAGLASPEDVAKYAVSRGVSLSRAAEAAQLAGSQLADFRPGQQARIVTGLALNPEITLAQGDRARDRQFERLASQGGGIRPFADVEADLSAFEKLGAQMGRTFKEVYEIFRPLVGILAEVGRGVLWVVEMFAKFVNFLGPIGKIGVAMALLIPPIQALTRLMGVLSGAGAVNGLQGLQNMMRLMRAAVTGLGKSYREFFASLGGVNLGGALRPLGRALGQVAVTFGRALSQALTGAMTGQALGSIVGSFLGTLGSGLGRVLSGVGKWAARGAPGVVGAAGSGAAGAAAGAAGAVGAAISWPVVIGLAVAAMASYGVFRQVQSARANNNADQLLEGAERGGARDERIRELGRALKGDLSQGLEEAGYTVEEITKKIDRMARSGSRETRELAKAIREAAQEYENMGKAAELYSNFDKRFQQNLSEMRSTGLGLYVGPSETAELLREIVGTEGYEGVTPLGPLDWAQRMWQGATDSLFNPNMAPAGSPNEVVSRLLAGARQPFENVVNTPFGEAWLANEMLERGFQNTVLESDSLSEAYDARTRRRMERELNRQAGEEVEGLRRATGTDRLAAFVSGLIGSFQNNLSTPASWREGLGIQTETFDMSRTPRFVQEVLAISRTRAQLRTEIQDRYGIDITNIKAMERMRRDNPEAFQQIRQIENEYADYSGRFRGAMDLRRQQVAAESFFGYETRNITGGLMPMVYGSSGDWVRASRRAAIDAPERENLAMIGMAQEQLESLRVGLAELGYVEQDDGSFVWDRSVSRRAGNQDDAQAQSAGRDLALLFIEWSKSLSDATEKVKEFAAQRIFRESFDQIFSLEGLKDLDDKLLSAILTGVAGGPGSYTVFSDLIKRISDPDTLQRFNRGAQNLIVADGSAAIRPGDTDRVPYNLKDLAGTPMEQVTVARVIDGDTVELTNGVRVRLTGIDTPEVGTEGAAEATRALEELVLGKNVLLEYEGSPEEGTRLDPHGRTLAYMYLEDETGSFRNPLLPEEFYQVPGNMERAQNMRFRQINQELIERGLAVPMQVGDNDLYAFMFDRTAAGRDSARARAWEETPAGPTQYGLRGPNGNITYIPLTGDANQESAITAAAAVVDEFLGATRDRIRSQQNELSLGNISQEQYFEHVQEAVAGLAQNQNLTGFLSLFEPYQGMDPEQIINTLLGVDTREVSRRQTELAASRRDTELTRYRTSRLRENMFSGTAIPGSSALLAEAVAQSQLEIAQETALTELLSERDRLTESLLQQDGSYRAPDEEFRVGLAAAVARYEAATAEAEVAFDTQISSTRYQERQRLFRNQLTAQGVSAADALYQEREFFQQQFADTGLADTERLDALANMDRITAEIQARVNRLANIFIEIGRQFNDMLTTFTGALGNAATTNLDKLRDWQRSILARDDLTDAEIARSVGLVRQADRSQIVYYDGTNFVPSEPASEVPTEIRRTSSLSNDEMFLTAVGRVLAYEGGHVADPNSHEYWSGGAVGVGELRGTNMGIAAHANPNVDIENLTRDDAIDIYRRNYWNYVPDDLSDGAKLSYFDMVVQHGPGNMQNHLWPKVQELMAGDANLSMVEAMRDARLWFLHTGRMKDDPRMPGLENRVQKAFADSMALDGNLGALGISAFTPGDQEISYTIDVGVQISPADQQRLEYLAKFLDTGNLPALESRRLMEGQQAFGQVFGNMATPDLAALYDTALADRRQAVLAYAGQLIQNDTAGEFRDEEGNLDANLADERAATIIMQQAVGQRPGEILALMQQEAAQESSRRASLLDVNNLFTGGFASISYQERAQQMLQAAQNYDAGGFGTAEERAAFRTTAERFEQFAPAIDSAVSALAAGDFALGQIVEPGPRRDAEAQLLLDIERQILDTIEDEEVAQGVIQALLGTRIQQQAQLERQSRKELENIRNRINFERESLAFLERRAQLGTGLDLRRTQSAAAEIEYDSRLAQLRFDERSQNIQNRDMLEGMDVAQLRELAAGEYGVENAGAMNDVMLRRILGGRMAADTARNRELQSDITTTEYQQGIIDSVVGVIGAGVGTFESLADREAWVREQLTRIDNQDVVADLTEVLDTQSFGDRAERMDELIATARREIATGNVTAETVSALRDELNVSTPGQRGVVSDVWQQVVALRDRDLMTEIAGMPAYTTQQQLDVLRAERQALIDTGLSAEIAPELERMARQEIDLERQLLVDEDQLRIAGMDDNTIAEQRAILREQRLAMMRPDVWRNTTEEQLAMTENLQRDAELTLAEIGQRATLDISAMSQRTAAEQLVAADRQLVALRTQQYLNPDDERQAEINRLVLQRQELIGSAIGERFNLNISGMRSLTPEDRLAIMAQRRAMLVAQEGYVNENQRQIELNQLGFEEEAERFAGRQQALQIDQLRGPAFSLAQRMTAAQQMIDLYAAEEDGANVYALQIAQQQREQATLAAQLRFQTEVEEPVRLAQRRVDRAQSPQAQLEAQQELVATMDESLSTFTGWNDMTALMNMSMEELQERFDDNAGAVRQMVEALETAKDASAAMERQLRRQNEATERALALGDYERNMQRGGLGVDDVLAGRRDVLALYQNQIMAGFRGGTFGSSPFDTGLPGLTYDRELLRRLAAGDTSLTDNMRDKDEAAYLAALAQAALDFEDQTTDQAITFAMRNVTERQASTLFAQGDMSFGAIRQMMTTFPAMAWEAIQPILAESTEAELAGVGSLEQLRAVAGNRFESFFQAYDNDGGLGVLSRLMGVAGQLATQDARLAAVDGDRSQLNTLASGFESLLDDYIAVFLGNIDQNLLARLEISPESLRQDRQSGGWSRVTDLLSLTTVPELQALGAVLEQLVGGVVDPVRDAATQLAIRSSERRFERYKPMFESPLSMMEQDLSMLRTSQGIMEAQYGGSRESLMATANKAVIDAYIEREQRIRDIVEEYTAYYDVAFNNLMSESVTGFFRGFASGMSEIVADLFAGTRQREIDEMNDTFSRDLEFQEGRLADYQRRRDELANDPNYNPLDPEDSERMRYYTEMIEKQRDLVAETRYEWEKAQAAVKTVGELIVDMVQNLGRMFVQRFTEGLINIGVNWVFQQFGLGPLSQQAPGTGFWLPPRTSGTPQPAPAPASQTPFVDPSSFGYEASPTAPKGVTGTKIKDYNITRSEVGSVGAGLKLPPEVTQGLAAGLTGFSVSSQDGNFLAGMGTSVLGMLLTNPAALTNPVTMSLAVVGAAIGTFVGGVKIQAENARREFLAESSGMADYGIGDMGVKGQPRILDRATFNIQTGLQGFTAEQQLAQVLGRTLRQTAGRTGFSGE